WRSPAAWSGPLRGASWPRTCGSGWDLVQPTASKSTRNKNPRTPVRGCGDVRSMVELYFNGWINDKPEGLYHFLHWLDLGRMQRVTFGLKMGDDVVDHVTQVGVHLFRIVSVNPCDEIGTLADVRFVFFTPFDPFMILVARFHS